MYKLINGWTKARVMKQVKKHNNGSQAWNSKRESCTYQAVDGNRCAVGCFIPGNHAALQYRGNAQELLIRFPELASRMPFGAKGLQKFQTIHDGSSPDKNRDIYKLIREFLNEEVSE